MGKFSSDEVGHGDEVFDATIAARPCARLLKGSIHRFDPAVVFARLEPVEYARKRLGDRPAEALERFESAAAGPRGRQERAKRSWRGCATAPQVGQA